MIEILKYYMYQFYFSRSHGLFIMTNYLMFFFVVIIQFVLSEAI